MTKYPRGKHPNSIAGLAQNRAVDPNLDWSKDPCKGCGKYPLSTFNKCGFCRKCSRSKRLGARPRPSRAGQIGWRVKRLAKRIANESLARDSQSR